MVIIIIYFKDFDIFKVWKFAKSRHSNFFLKIVYPDIKIVKIEKWFQINFYKQKTRIFYLIS